ncbi:cAMP-binding domain of CRP or a regulatory subunit of cAMP-dependent protein kinases [Chryseobacterium soldanellicola]|uniref:cAMP-binding domain of CRP or a regulatory subunit of cAMP-dependent protein kinases n=1 Tax=Chryseobacterium soldanellicola TaxID=311333 RepID=A0A1H1GXZ2_9FLAO|nr:Crp/Fnr family transcriptional regulator [Chryseobacterium soldanellicola]SDR18030.1 cAMP-binding domain of CRP or a regulatory subunit of cAMP-dependent protein kinases [Chryseobacterium soldanellicola]
MYEPLFDYIERYSNSILSSEEKEKIQSLLLPKKLRKKQYFLEEGNVCPYTGFILKGAIRQFSVDSHGIEYILQLALENWWIVDRQSFVNQTPSKYYIEAWENTELLILPRPNLDAFLEIPSVRDMFWKMSENNHIASQKRVDDAISLSALERYESFVQLHPDMIQRFPLHQIASYLGISRETLSRIRKQSFR